MPFSLAFAEDHSGENPIDLDFSHDELTVTSELSRASVTIRLRGREMSMEKLSNERLAQKIRWEGGLRAALDYGIDRNEIQDPQVADLWRRLDRSYREFGPLLDDAMRQLDVSA